MRKQTNHFSFPIYSLFHHSILSFLTALFYLAFIEANKSLHILCASFLENHIITKFSSLNALISKTEQIPHRKASFYAGGLEPFNVYFLILVSLFFF